MEEKCRILFDNGLISCPMILRRPPSEQEPPPNQIVERPVKFEFGGLLGIDSASLSLGVYGHLCNSSLAA